jgi:RNA polymerase-binding transcription factor DksA
LHETDLRLLRAIEEALVRIRHGTFGTCEACLNPISRTRLEAVPWTRHCRDCKEHEHSLRDETSKNATGSSAW